MTFEEAKTSDIFTLMPRTRLAGMQRDIYAQLDSLQLGEVKSVATSL